MRPYWILVAALGAACSSPSAPRDPASIGPAMAFLATPEAVAIAALEDRRSDGGGALEGYLEHPDPRVRERAAVALGRLWWPECGDAPARALLAALDDAAPNVREAAAFSLGMLGDPATADRLLQVALSEHAPPSEGPVRARALEAACKLARPDLRETLLLGLQDRDANVRRAVAQGSWTWEGEYGTPPGPALLAALETESDAEVRRALLFSLSRLRFEGAREAFERFATHEDADTRLFAVRGLARLPYDEDMEEAALPDDDWRVASEALALFPVLASQLQTAVDQAVTPNPNVRVSAWSSLDRWLVPDDAADPKLRGRLRLLSLMLTDEEDSPWVWGERERFRVRWRNELREAAEGLGIGLTTPEMRSSPSEVHPWLYDDLLAGDRDPLSLVGAAQGLAYWDTAEALPHLERLLRDERVIVAGAALAALGSHPTPEARALVLPFLAHADNGLRLAAVTALQQVVSPAEVEPLIACYESSRGDIATEIRFNVLRALRTAGGTRVESFLEAQLEAGEPFVRRVAWEALRDRADEESTPARPPYPERGATEVPVPGVDHPLYETNPWVAVETDRGTLRFELFPAETPLHVHSFLTLAERDHYDGLPFHRVVPDFVIQGGDRRGDGNGGGTWRGPDDSLRHEIGPRRYVRGSLGMPRNEDPDSGGSQIFVTHRATPHLDGRYTIFGELREGFDVLDAIEVGDRILDVRRIAPPRGEAGSGPPPGGIWGSARLGPNRGLRRPPR